MKITGEDVPGWEKNGDQRRKMKTHRKDPSAGASAPTSQDDLSAGQNGAGSCIKQQLFCPTAGVAARRPPFPARAAQDQSGQTHHQRLDCRNEARTDYVEN